MNQVSFGAAAFILALSMPLAANAQAMGDMKGMNMPAAPAASAGATASSTAHATGVVKKVDVGAGIVTIAHEAIPGDRVAADDDGVPSHREEALWQARCWPESRIRLRNERQGFCRNRREVTGAQGINGDGSHIPVEDC